MSIRYTFGWSDPRGIFYTGEDIAEIGTPFANDFSMHLYEEDHYLDDYALIVKEDDEEIDDGNEPIRTSTNSARKFFRKLFGG